MSRTPRVSKRCLAFIILSFVGALILVSNFGGAGAQSIISGPSVLPGDLGTFAAAGTQEQQRLSKGADTILAVWTDRRTSINITEAGTRSAGTTGDGSQTDIYAARLNAAGQVIDTTPIVVDQGGFTQNDARVGWNGQNWLVVYTSQKEDDYFQYEMRARRVSPAGQVLDASPIILDADVPFRHTLAASVIDDGAGNWVVTYQDTLPIEGTSIPAGAFVMRVADNGTVLDPGGRVVYNHHSQYMNAPRLTRAGDRYLLTFHDMISPGGLRGLTLDANFVQLRNGPEMLIASAGGYDVASDGNSWFVTSTGGASGNVQNVNGTRVNRDGDPVDSPPLVITSNAGTSLGETAVCWDGQYWFVAYASGYDPATQSYLNATDIYVARLTPSGAALDPQGRAVKVAEGHQTSPAIAPGVGGGVQIAWQESQRFDVNTARVSREAAVSAEGPLALAAPRQSEVRMATNGSGFLAVFRSETSGVSRIMGQHLDAQGNAVDQEPFVVADGAKNNNPSVGWDGAQYLVVWDDIVPQAAGETRFTTSQTFGRLVPSTGPPLAPEFYIMDGHSPDAAGLSGQFLVVNIIPKTTQIKKTQAVRVSGAGVRAGDPVEIEGVFNSWPRAVAFNNRWLAVWEYHANHDDAPGTIRGSFVEPDGTVRAPFVVGDAGNDRTPHLAVGANNTALVVWSTNDIYARRINADGTSPDQQSVALVTNPAVQSRPAVTWDGEQFVLDWVDQRNEPFPFQAKGDIFGARVSATNVKLEEFAVADSPLPEESPFVISLNGLTIFSYAKFYDDKPNTEIPSYASHRITLRRADLPTPNLGLTPNAPGNLVAAQNVQGVGTVTLTWADNSDNETGFKIEMRSVGGVWSQVSTAGAGATSKGGFTVSADASTSFRLRAYNASGDSAYSNEASAPVARMGVFSPQVYKEPATVAVSATASDPEGVARVEFYSSTNSSTGYTLLATDTQAPYTYDWQNLSAGYYYVKAKAYDNQGSTTEVLYESFVVHAAPTATITAPVNNAPFPAGSSITITANAQARNDGDYLVRTDFYANTTFIGSVQGSYAEYSFTWQNVSTGSYSLTARPVSNTGLTGTSAPVQVRVGNPGFNISGRVTDGTNPIYGVTLIVPGHPAQTDVNGDYVITNLAAGGSYTVTPVVAGYTFSPASLTFNNLSGNLTANFTATPKPSMNIDPNAAPIYAQASDGRATEGPSTRTTPGQQVDQEVADDFELSAAITRVRIRGYDGTGPTHPDYVGVYVRFYDGASGKPGELQQIYYLPKGAPNVVSVSGQPSAFDITLPGNAFNATGKHFVSVQPVFKGTTTWWVVSANYPNVRGAGWHKRDNLSAGREWTLSSSVGETSDISFDLFGTPQSLPRIDTTSPEMPNRSGIVKINGAFFGPERGTGQVRIDGLASPLVSYWSDNLILAHVPEGAQVQVGVALEVTTGAGLKGSKEIIVLDRQSDGRVRWRAEVAGDYSSLRPAVAPPGVPGAGTVYAATNAGYLYAWTPDGALKWVAPGADGYHGPVSVGPDGTIYAAYEGFVAGVGTAPGVIAFNPDGTRKWVFSEPKAQSLRAGPNVGPDGKIYFILRPLSSEPSAVNFGALRPDGTLAWNVNRNFWTYGQIGKELTFGRTLPHVYFSFNSDSDPDPILSGGLFAYNFDGQLIWQRGGLCCGVPAVAPDEDLRHGAARFNALTGTRIYEFDFPDFAGQGPDGMPVAGPDNVHYVKGSGRLWAINPNGTQKWYYEPQLPEGGIASINNPNVNPTNTTILMGGGGSYAQESFFVGVNPANGEEMWRQLLPRTPGFGEYDNIFLANLAAFTPDGNTGYMAGDQNGDQNLPFGQKFAYFYAVDTSTDDVPINEQPKVTMTSPLDGSNHPKNETINLAATASDDQPVSGVEFYVQRSWQEPEQLISTDTTAPYTAAFNPGTSGGMLIARVRDAGGLVGDSRVWIMVGNNAPRVTWVNPTNGARLDPGSDVTLTVEADDADGTVTEVNFYADTEFNTPPDGFIGTDTTPDAQGRYEAVLPDAPAGTYNLHAVATDNDGVDRRIIITVNVAPPPTPTPVPTPTPTPVPNPNAPSVRITSPVTGSSFAPGATVNFTAEASDPDGTVARVEFWRDFSLEPLCADFNAPYACQVSSIEPDIYNVSAVAHDNAGNSTQSAKVQIVFHDPSGPYTISGRLRHEQSAPGNEVFLPNARVELLLRNSLFREARTDAQGNYSFDYLNFGGDYTVRPAEPGYQFYPPSASWIGLVESVTQDFVAEGPLPPGPTPTPTPGANVLAWEKTYNSPSNSSDFDTRVAVDSQGNTYVTGESSTPNGGSTGDTDIATVKYGPAGDLLWAKTFAGPGNYKDWPTDIRVDAQGNVYVVGTSWRGSAYSYDLVTIKYNASGAEQWARYVNGPLGAADMGNAMELDSSGNVVVVGYDRTRDPVTNKNFDEFVTVKYSPDGTEQWAARRSQSQLGDHAIDVAVDSQGNSYVTGFAWTAAGGNGSKDLVTVKYSPAGVELWAALQDGRPGTPGLQPLPNNPIADEPGGVGLDPSGNVYVFGSNEPGTADDDFLLLKYDPATGALIWGRNWTGPAYDYARDMAIDGAGNIYLTGESYDVVFQTVNDNPSSDAATVKFAPDGTLLWARFYRAFPGKWDGGREIALDSAGNAYVGAYSEGFFNSDTVLVKYRPDGSEGWVYRYDNPSHSSDSLEDMTADAAGNLYVTGDAMITSDAGAESMDFVTFKLAAASATLNSPPDVELILGPSVAGNPSSRTAPSGPTVVGGNVFLSANAFDRDGTVAKVDFYDSGVLLGTDATAPYGFEWAGASEGKHAVTAMATDNAGATRTSESQSVTVAPAPPQVYTIGGRITDSGGGGLAGATVSLNGPQATTTTTGADGRYSFVGLAAGGDYTVTPSKGGHTFTPPTRTLNALGSDQTADFTAAPAQTTGRFNHALASRGATATASSRYDDRFPAEAAIDGNRRALYMADGRFNIWASAGGAGKPDWLRVDFAGAKTIDEINVLTQQDNYTAAAEPTEQTTFTQYGLTSFDVQHWDGSQWVAIPGGSVTGNDKVWRKFTFPALTTNKIRVLAHAATDGYSRVWEVEAWGGTAATPPPTTTRSNFALAANGGVATASSNYDARFPAAATIDGSRRALYMTDGRFNIWASAGGAGKPDWLRVDFAGAKTIDEVSVVTQQDDFANASEPTEATTFQSYGLTAFDVQYLDGTQWVTIPGGVVTGNDKVWRKFTFPAVTTSSIRVVAHNAVDGYSRVWEIEAWGGGDVPPPPSAVNVALASNGATATASSNYDTRFPDDAAIDGSRRSLYMTDGRFNIWASAAGAAKPDWLEVNFGAARTVSEIDVVTMQDDFTNPVEPTDVTSFTQYGATAFDVQYWDGASWVTIPGGSVTGNDKVWRKFTFPTLTTNKIRVLVHAATDGHARIMEVEAWTK